MITTPTRPNDTLARYAVYALCALALWAGVRQLERPATSAQAQDIIILQATPTPALPTPAPDAPAFVLEAPTPAPVGQPAIEAPPTAYSDVPAARAPQNGAGELDNSDYIANVGAQAEHSPRGDVEQLPNAQGGPILYPDQNMIIEPAGLDAAPPPAAPAIAVAVPLISAEQAAVLAQRQSNGCPAGQTFYPRTGCHAPGSGGPQPGAVGEVQP